LYFLPEPQGQFSLRPTLPQLVGLAGSRWGAVAVAAPAPPRSRDAGARERLRPGQRQRHLVLAGRGIDVVRRHGGQAQA
jgi:hypothetical protein